MANRICHIEFVTTEFREAGRIFSELFGWKTFPSGENYVVWQAGETRLGGGFSSDFSGQHAPGTIIYISVDDIEASLKLIAENGGSVVHEKTKISDEHGCYALFSDPCGTTVGLWSKD